MPVTVDLAGKVALVTGGGTGLGRPTAIRLAEAGAKVVVASNHWDSVAETADYIRQSGGEATAFHADISDEQQVETLARQIGETYGGVDILINNAAIYPSKPYAEVTAEEWDRVFAVNIRGYFLCAKAVLPHMREQGWGRIVNLSSITYFLGFKDLIAYVSSKGAVIGFTRALAREVGPYGVTVNSIAPGAFPTAAEQIHPDPEGYNQYVLDNQSLKRRGTPEDIADAVLFFASDLSRFITGQSLLVDGGWAME